MATLHIKPPLLYTIATIWPPVCTAVVIARFAVRRSQRGKTRTGWDDWLVLPAIATIYGMAGSILAGTALKGLGQPTPRPTPDSALSASSYQENLTRKVHIQTRNLFFFSVAYKNKIYFAFLLVHTVSLTLVKISCLLFFGRVFRTHKGNLVAISLDILVVLTAIWGIGFFFGFLFLCRTSFWRLWTAVEASLKCASVIKINKAVSISDAIMDFVIMIYPMPLIWTLKMSLRRKLALTIIFLLGTCAILASVIRAVINFELAEESFSKTADEDFVSTGVMYFMFHEACFALTAICLPTLAGGLKIAGVQNFIQGAKSLFLCQWPSTNFSREWTDGREILGSQASGMDEYSPSGQHHENVSNVELQDRHRDQEPRHPQPVFSAV